MGTTSASGSLHVDTSAWKLILNFNTFNVDESFGELDDPQECFERYEHGYTREVPHPEYWMGIHHGTEEADGT